MDKVTYHMFRKFFEFVDDVSEDDLVDTFELTERDFVVTVLGFSTDIATDPADGEVKQLVTVFYKVVLKEQ